MANGGDTRVRYEILVPDLMRGLTCQFSWSAVRRYMYTCNALLRSVVGTFIALGGLKRVARVCEAQKGLSLFQRKCGFDKCFSLCAPHFGFEHHVYAEMHPDHAHMGVSPSF